MKKYKKLVTAFLFLFLFISQINAETLNEPNIYSKFAILQDYNTGTILYQKNIDEKLYPASTTKILTAITAIENGNLNEIVTANPDTLKLLPPYSSNAAIKPNEKLTLKELLQTLIVVSGNDSALIIADAVSGDIPTFVNLMNETARKIGCTNTQFVNPHGYHDENHYTTARDMVKIFRYGLQYDEFRELLAIKELIIPATNTTPQRHYISTNRMFFKKEEIGSLAHFYPYNKGGKTGFTNEALRTFVGYAEKDGRTLITGVFYIKNVNGEDGKFLDAENLYNHGFNDYVEKTLIKKDTKVVSIIDDKTKKDYKFKEDFKQLLPKENNTLIKYKFDITNLHDNTFINVIQDTSTKVYNISINSTNLDKNPYLYHDITYKDDFDFFKILSDRIKINIYNLKLKLKI